MSCARLHALPKRLSRLMVACLLAAPLSSRAQLIAHEAFDYAAASLLTAQTGGSGWGGAWTQDGASAQTGSAGLGYADTLGNSLHAAGLCADSSGSTTTRSLRIAAPANLNNVWISFLYHLPASNNKFEGVSFYRGSQQVLTVSNPSTTSTAAIFLSNNLSGGASVNTGRGAFGQTHLVVLKLTKGGGSNGSDRAEAFIDPVLTANPSSPSVVDGANFDFDRIRIAGQDGSTLLVDEIRIGTSFADVTPHSAPAELDSDGDGLTDAQEAILGLDPQVSDAQLIAAIRANPEWFGLLSEEGILHLAGDARMLRRGEQSAVKLVFELQQSAQLTHWVTRESFLRFIEMPEGKHFLRIHCQEP